MDSAARITHIGTSRISGLGKTAPTAKGRCCGSDSSRLAGGRAGALIDGGLFTQKSFWPFRSVATPEEGVEVLDKIYDPVPPMYTPEELAALRSQEKKLFGPAAV